jgi:uncharacterized repeat protein (TIGR03837 family)
MNIRDNTSPANKRQTVDIFCRVVDNYGDAGVCWRLARQMAFEHGLKVRLIIDQLDVLASLVPKLAKSLNRLTSKRSRVRRSRSHAPAMGYLVDGVRIFEWKTRKSPTPMLVGPARLLKPAQLVIAAFACELPESYRLLMEKSNAKARVWMNLEYLSAEPWVDTHHLLPSLKPSGLTEHFFFPGFNERTGGLLRERALLDKRDAFLQDRTAQEKLAAELGIAGLFDHPRGATLVIFVFSYPQAPFQSLVNAAGAVLEMGTKKRVAKSLGKNNSAFKTSEPDMRPQTDLDNVQRIWFLCPQSAPGAQLQYATPNGVEVKAIPRLPQERFDEILWLSDANFVRGEDSFVRAIWAGKPMIWNIYPQEEQVHRPKLEAFLALRPAEERALSLSWNQLDDASKMLSDSFEAWLAAYPSLATQGRSFASHLALQDDLCLQLLRAGSLAT